MRAVNEGDAARRACTTAAVGAGRNVFAVTAYETR